VILDVFSRYAVGWTVEHRESGQVAKALIAQVCEQQIARDQLTIHAEVVPSVVELRDGGPGVMVRRGRA
jgi:transposase InsO family protein